MTMSCLYGDTADTVIFNQLKKRDLFCLKNPAPVLCLQDQIR